MFDVLMYCIVIKMEERNECFFLVGNIPKQFHASELRAFFSNFIEKGGFVSFHYRHRPERFADSSSHDGSESQPDVSSSGGDVHTDKRQGLKTAKTNCCVVVVAKSLEKEFLEVYQNRNWSSPDGELLPSRVRINKLSVSAAQPSTLSEDDKGRHYSKPGENDNLAAVLSTDDGKPPETRLPSSSVIPWSELNNLPELNPPSVMPQGNVGTPLAVFMSLIRSCRLPGRIIKKLKLEFPKSRTKNRYGAVGLDYGTTVEGSACLEDIAQRSKQKDKDPEKEESIPSDDDHDAEEWERYEALHDDVDKQERTKERLFEEELEVVWDKGSSGLVFYTDASYWDQQDGDFDEKCSQEDDWDVDLSGYYDYSGGDKDASDLKDIEMERKLRQGEDIGTWRGLAGFERHTTGIGSRLLKRSGWTEGGGVGVSGQGISEPVELEGQQPHNKRGLGYRGEKLDGHAHPRKKQRASRDVIISTVYDKPDEESDTLLRTAPTRTIKYRESVKFLKGNVKPDV